MTVKGFWHILLINNWYSIVETQIRILITSGLYDKCQEISIGALGNEENKKYFEQLILNKYSKLKLKYYSIYELEYEYPTLELIEKDNSQYAGFYFHSKGITQPFNTEVSNWRAWMNEEILNLWKQHYMNIVNGYDISGVNYLEGYNHYSGNFFWFNRRYIDKLPQISNLDHENRWGAEQWICSVENKKFNKGNDNNYIIQFRK